MPPVVLDNGSTYLPVAETCDLPAAETADQVVVVGAYEGRDYASVTVAGQAGPTTYASVDVRTDAPVYLVLSSMESLVWEIDGPVDRVIASTLGGNSGEGVGIVGVDPERIIFLNPDCPTAVPYRIYDEGPDAVLAATATGQRVGVPRSAYAGSYTISHVVVADGDAVAHADPPGGQPRGHPWRQGAVEVDVMGVVASVPAEYYGAYPGETGLNRLRQSGSIKAASARDFSPWMSGYLSRPDVDIADLTVVRERFAGAYIVVSATQLPAPNPWYDRYIWLVPSGVAEPVEPSGTQCVFLMDGYRFSGPDECPGQLASQ